MYVKICSWLFPVGNVLYIYVYSILQKTVVKKQRPWTEALPNKFLHRQSNFLSELPVHSHFNSSSKGMNEKGEMIEIFTVLIEVF